MIREVENEKIEQKQALNQQLKEQIKEAKYHFNRERF